MQRPEDNSVRSVSYLIEHSHGTCELWIKQTDTAETKIYEPLRLRRVSGVCTVLLRAEMIAQAILLEEWMADYFEVFKDGRTSYN